MNVFRCSTTVRFTCLMGLAVSVGCGNTRVEASGKVVRMDSEALAVEVQTISGATVTIDGKKATTNEQGQAMVTVPMKYYETKLRRNYHSVNVSVQKEGLLSDESAHFKVKLPMLPMFATLIPKSTSKPWLRVVGSATQGGGAARSLLVTGDFGDEARVYFDKTDRAGLKLAAPVKAKVTIAGKAVKFDQEKLANYSLGSYSLDGESLIRRWPVTGLERKSKHELKLPVRVAFGDSEVVTGQLKISFAGIRKAVKDRLARVKKGKPLFSSPATSREGSTRMVLYVNRNKKLIHVGAKGTLGQVDRVAFARVSGRRKGKKCSGYAGLGEISGGRALKREYVDIEVTQYDARSGKKVESKIFKGGEQGCPKSAKEHSIIQDGPKQKTIEAWLRRGS